MRGIAVMLREAMIEPTALADIAQVNWSKI